MKLRVIRAFILAGSRQDPGTDIDVADRAFAFALINDGKAIEQPAEEPEAPRQTRARRGPMSTASVPGLVSGGQAETERTES